MATKRQRASGTWEFIIKRKGLLDRPYSFTSDSEADGDKHASRLEALLDNGVIPAEINASRSPISTVADAIDAFETAEYIPTSDKQLLSLAQDELGKVKLSQINAQWVDRLLSEYKRERRLAPSTIRHRVGALARCLDWCVRHSYIGMNARLFPWIEEDFAEFKTRNLEETYKRVTAMLSRQFVRIFLAAECEDLTFHDLRHEATCRIYERTTLTDVQIARMTGHKRLEMLKRYASLRGSDLAVGLW